MPAWATPLCPRIASGNLLPEILQNLGRSEMKRVILLILLSGCAQIPYTVSQFQGVIPKTTLDAAETECKAYAFADKNIELKAGFVSCMAKNGYKVTY
jgi:predicted transcriptional regulator with HTH domain